MITLLYKTDFQHSFSSRELIGAFTNKIKLNSAVKKIVKEDLKANPQDLKGQELTQYINWNINFFHEKKQTQGLSSFELVSEEVEVNIIF